MGYSGSMYMHAPIGAFQPPQPSPFRPLSPVTRRPGGTDDGGLPPMVAPGPECPPCLAPTTCVPCSKEEPSRWWLWLLGGLVLGSGVTYVATKGAAGGL